MKLLNDDVSAYRTGVGLLAIHSAISLNDAIIVGITGHRGKYENHVQAADELDNICKLTKVMNSKGVRHLRWLLAKKNRVAYEHRRLDDDSVQMAVDLAKKFHSWAYNYFREVLRVQANA